MGTWKQDTNANNGVEVNYTGTNFYHLACNNGSHDGKGKPMILFALFFVVIKCNKSELFFAYMRQVY